MIKRLFSRPVFNILNAINLLIVCLIFVVSTFFYVFSWNIHLFITMFLINAMIFLLALFVYQFRLYFGYVVVGLIYVPIFIITSWTDSILYYVYLFPSILILLIGLASGVFQIASKNTPKAKGVLSIGIASIILISMGFCAEIQPNIYKLKTEVEMNTWAVPNFVFETKVNEGTLEEIEYPTKAYATDKRELNKKAYVYLPYDYDTTKQYDILYLMHGTGDNHAYWLKKHKENKQIVDFFIEKGFIDPLIVVTPTWYTENDCSKDLDKLTYSFKDELRNDLMPYIESRYSTFSSGVNDEDFVSSRDHRFFAGLSRGATTMYHAALCGSLDYFTKFGGFSGTWTTAKEFKESLQSNEFKHFSIDLLYASTGTLDFAMPTASRQYHSFLEVEPRLKLNKNTRFDSYYFKQHMPDTWTLSLYNFLLLCYSQK